MTTTTIAAAAAATSTRLSSTNAQQTKQEAADALDIYDEIEIEDMTFDKTLQIYHYPCPCGDRFEINIADLRDGEDVAVCPSCSLMIRVIFDLDDLPEEEEKKKEAGKVLLLERERRTFGSFLALTLLVCVLS